MILKARYKSFEDMPEWAKCCPATIEAIKPFCGLVIEIDSNTIVQNYDCPFCGKHYSDGSGKAFPVVRNNSYAGNATSASLIDIDEGQGELA